MQEWEDFKEQTNRVTEGYIQYEKKDIKCPKCGQPIYKNMTVVLASLPPQYAYKCLNCG